MFEGIMIGLTTAFTLSNLMMVIGGCLIGTFIGMLPGLGPMSIISIMIPVAITIGDPSAALILLAGVYYGAIFGGSTSSILINAPGVASTVATSFDGYPLAPILLLTRWLSRSPCEARQTSRILEYCWNRKKSMMLQT